ncbi:hypothetical protein [Nostoc sp.]|uniref:hypothetical protein n=1 Tax=Nostoc sp. TaxID=1180 RepID=UPI002FFC2C10
MASQREAVIFVHGFYLGRDRNHFIDCLSVGLTEVLEFPRIKEIGEEKITGHIGKKFKLDLGKNSSKEIDIYDAYWNDLFSKQLSGSNLKTQVFRGIYILFYWFFTKNLLALRNSPPLLIGLGTSLVLWIFWFYGIVGLAFVALGQEPNFLGFPIPEDWSKPISSFGKQMTNWSAWLVVSGIFSFVPINLIADIADFSTRYLEENSEGKILKAKIRKQVADKLNAVLETGLYDRVTILAHSFGVVIATDLLADYQEDHRVRYISMGGCLKLLSCKSRQLEKEISKCLDNEKIEAWIDFYSDQDWLCTKTPILKKSNPERIQQKETRTTFSLWKQLTGESHDHYFTNEEVLKAVLNLQN